MSSERLEVCLLTYFDCVIAIFLLLGDMDHILESVLCCTFEDEPRFHDIIKQWIKDGSVPQFKFVATETKKKRQQRKKRYELEAKEAEELRKELGLDDSGEGE